AAVSAKWGKCVGGAAAAIGEPADAPRPTFRPGRRGWRLGVAAGPLAPRRRPGYNARQRPGRPPSVGRDPFPADHAGTQAMRTMIAAALVFGLVGLSAGQDKKADPTGTWRCETDVMGQKRESTLRLKTEGGKLTGTVSWADKKE